MLLIRAFEDAAEAASRGGVAVLGAKLAADAWVRQPNTAAPFGGQTALTRMLAGNVSDLNLVRRYLDGVRGGARVRTLRDSLTQTRNLVMKRERDRRRLNLKKPALSTEDGYCVD